MVPFALLLLLAAEPQSRADDAETLRSEVARLEGEKRALEGALRERDAVVSEVREQLRGLREDVRELKERPLPPAAHFLASPPLGSDRLGVARNAVFAPRIEVDSYRRHDTIALRLRRLEIAGIRTLAELELTPDLSGIDLPLDQNGAVYVIEWSTSEGHLYDLVLRDGASGQPAAAVPVKEKQNEGRFVLVGFRLE